MSRVAVRLDRLALGVCGGLLLSLGALFAVAAMGVEAAQTGSSAGKGIFFSVWALAVGVALLQSNLRRATSLYLVVAGALFFVSAPISLAMRGMAMPASCAWLGVNAGLLVVGLVLLAVGARLHRGRRQGTTT